MFAKPILLKMIENFANESIQNEHWGVFICLEIIKNEKKIGDLYIEKGGIWKFWRSGKSKKVKELRDISPGIVYDIMIALLYHVNKTESKEYKIIITKDYEEYTDDQLKEFVNY